LREILLRGALETEWVVDRRNHRSPRHRLGAFEADLRAGRAGEAGRKEFGDALG